MIPGGIYGHTTPAATIPGAVPYFAATGHRCRYTDIDGNTFIDFMGGYGPLVLGYHHPEVEAAADAARARGAAFNHPTPFLVELAEKLTQRIDFADWAVFAKNGADLVNWSILVAREVTRRPKILKIAGAYHGTAAWCTPGHGGLIPSDRADIHDFPFNDTAALEALFARHRGHIAGLILTPFHHPAFADSQLPTPAFVAACNRLCREHGALQILDDVRCGFRLTTDGSHSLYGYTPDLAIYCKALANGHPISACVGRAAHKPAASRVFLTGSYWGDPAPMAAALATLDIIARDHIPARLKTLGERFVSGFLALGEKHNTPLVASGPAAMPYVRVADDPSFLRTQRLCAAAVANGVFLHPHHNWFVSAAMTGADIDEALARLDAAFAAAFSTPSPGTFVPAPPVAPQAAAAIPPQPRAPESLQPSPPPGPVDLATRNRQLEAELAETRIHLARCLPRLEQAFFIRKHRESEIELLRNRLHHVGPHHHLYRAWQALVGGPHYRRHKPTSAPSAPAGPHPAAISGYHDLFIDGLHIRFHKAALADIRGTGRVARELFHHFTDLSRPPSEQAGSSRRLVHFFAAPHWGPETLPPGSCVLIHDTIPLLTPDYPKDQAAIFENRCRSVIRQAAKLITISRTSARDITRFFGVPADAIEVILNGVTRLPVAASPAPPLPSAPYLVYVGGADSHKNLSVVLEALTRPPARDVHLVLVGENERHRVLAEVFNLRERVHFLGRQEDAALGYVIRNAAALVFPSLHEGFGLPPLEAALLGVPSICGRRPAMTELLADAALFAEPDSPEEWARCIRALTTDPALRISVAARARAAAEDLSWPRAARAFVAAFKSMP